MKTSKIILFSYIGLLALAFLTFVVYLKSVDTKPKHRKTTEYLSLTADLTAFSTLIIKNEFVIISSGDEDLLLIYYIKDSVKPQINYVIKNDSLFIEASDKYDHLQIYINDDSRKSMHISSDNAGLRFDNFSMDSVWLKVFSGNNFQSTGKNEFVYMDASLKNARLFMNDLKVNQLNLTMDHSTLQLRNYLFEVSGTIQNSSELRIGKTTHIDIDTDNSSRFYCYP